MFYLSKFSFLVAQPLTWVVMLLVLALVISMTSSRMSTVRQLLALAVTLLLLIGWTPLSNEALRSLEDRYKPPIGDLSKFTGMIVLGGVFGNDDGRGRGQIALSGSAERVIVPVTLMSQYPEMRLLFTGGEAALLPTGAPEAASARNFFDRIGVDAVRITYEDASRNTFENSEMSARLPGVDIKAPWLLVTSASHIPRAMATFAHTGWNVTAYPVDYNSAVDVSLLSYSLAAGANAWQVALREWIGLLVYRAMGKAR
jgi:uncharacterized SAM-binding protein YcdF (DUF218 family)